MKKMMKLIAMLTVVALMLGCVSCTLFKNYDYVNEAIAKTLGADALDLEMKTDIKVTAGETSEDLSYVYNVQMQGLQTKTPRFLTNVDVTLFGDTVPATVYGEDTYFYVVTEQDSVKLASGDLISKTDFADEWKARLVAVPEDVLKNAVETVNADGTKTVVLTYMESNAAYDHLIAQWKENLVGKYVGECSESVLTPSNMTVTAVINETTGYLVSYTIAFDANIVAKTVEGEEKTLSANIMYRTDYHAIGDAVTLNAPEGYADFEETDGLPLNAYEMMKDSVMDALFLTDFQADFRLDIAFAMSGMNMEIPTKITLSVKNALTDDKEFQYSMVTSMLGMDITQHIYYKDNFYYYFDEINKVKYEKNDETDEKYDYRTDVEMILKSLPEEAFKGIEVQRNADGTKTMTLTLNGGLLLRYYTDFVNMADELEIGDVTWKSADITLVWNKDNSLKSYTIDAKGDTIINEISSEASLVYGLEYKSTENVTVEVPEDLDAYLTMAEMNGVVFDIVNNAVQKTLEANEFIIDAYHYVEIDIEGEYLCVEQECSIAANRLQTISPIYRYFAESYVNESYYEEDVYYENGYYYIDSELHEKPFKIKEEYAPSYNVLAFISKALKVLPESAIEKVEIEGSQGAVCKLYWAIDPSEFKTVYPEIADISLWDYQISTVICREAGVYISVDVNGSLMDYYVYADFVATISEPGTSYQMNYYVEMYYQFDTSGSAVIITPPENYQDYPLNVD